MITNLIYQKLLKNVLRHGQKVTTRNHETYSNIFLDTVTFYSFPLVTVRKTAWKKALLEMEWFLSGNDKCPDELLDWWELQLSYDNRLIDGYPDQFRNYNYGHSFFDQVQFIKDSLKTNPNSRRLLMTSWNPGEMMNITSSNNNSNTPTSCHGIVIQFFVRDGKLHMSHYQRSADMLLGVPHNWAQYWAMLLYFSYHAGLDAGSMRWIFGDAHIYNEASHIETANAIIDADVEYSVEPVLTYTPTTKDFKASDFSLTGKVANPIVLTRPKLL